MTVSYLLKPNLNSNNIINLLRMTKSIYKYAAEAGIPVGLYFTLEYICIFFGNRFPPLSTLFLLLFVSFPFLLWRLMKKLVALQPGYRKYSSLWLYGIYVIIFGTLISSLFSALYLTFINPGFITDYVTETIATIEQLPDPAVHAASIDVMQRALDNHLLPNRMEFVAATGWSSCFFGSILSMFLALLVSRQKRKSVGMWR